MFVYSYQLGTLVWKKTSQFVLYCSFNIHSCKTQCTLFDVLMFLCLYVYVSFSRVQVVCVCVCVCVCGFTFSGFFTLLDMCVFLLHLFML